MTRRFAGVAAIAFLVAMPFLVRWVIVSTTGLPREVRIATGPEGGRYRVICEGLAAEIESKLNVPVTLIHTQGSLDNLRLLNEGAVDFALYQPGTSVILDEKTTTRKASVAFISNMYSEVLHLVVRRGSEIHHPEDLIGKRVAVGQSHSGDYAMSRVVLGHFRLSEKDIESLPLDYNQILSGFDDGTLDAAIITAGLSAPVLERLFAGGKCDLVDISFAEAMAAKNLALATFRIPAGLYHSRSPVEPPRPVETVAMRAQLLTRENASATLAEEVTRLVLNEEFLKSHELSELFNQGKEFARAKPEFAIHPGAQHYYDPALKPLLNTEFVEATEGMRSFLVSVLIAVYLAYRWFKRRQARATEHTLDRYIQSLLGIERRQLHLDEGNGDVTNEIRQLQRFLDELTRLRQDALRDFTAHDLAEDRAADCFLEMCHALSDKIDAKLTRLRFDSRMRELTEVIGSGNGGAKPKVVR